MKRRPPARSIREALGRGFATGVIVFTSFTVTFFIGSALVPMTASY